jgi:hypothetical protein
MKFGSNVEEGETLNELVLDANSIEERVSGYKCGIVVCDVIQEWSSK